MRVLPCFLLFPEGGDLVAISRAYVRWCADRCRLVSGDSVGAGYQVLLGSHAQGFLTVMRDYRSVTLRGSEESLKCR